MEQFLSSLVHHDPIAVHSLDLMGAARFAVEFCSSSPSPEVALAIRVVVDLVGDEGFGFGSAALFGLVLYGCLPH